MLRGLEELPTYEDFEYARHVGLGLIEFSGVEFVESLLGQQLRLRRVYPCHGLLGTLTSCVLVEYTSQPDSCFETLHIDTAHYAYFDNQQIDVNRTKLTLICKNDTLQTARINSRIPFAKNHIPEAQPVRELSAADRYSFQAWEHELTSDRPLVVPELTVALREVQNIAES